MFMDGMLQTLLAHSLLSLLACEALHGAHTTGYNSEKHPLDSNWNQLLKQIHLKSSENFFSFFFNNFF